MIRKSKTRRRELSDAARGRILSRVWHRNWIPTGIKVNGRRIYDFSLSSTPLSNDRLKNHFEEIDSSGEYIISPYITRRGESKNLVKITYHPR